MAADLGRDVWCAYQGAWVTKSEYNSDHSCYHEPKQGTPYVAVPWGACKCFKCDATDRTECKNCKYPAQLKLEYLNGTTALSRCDMCLAQYMMQGKLK